MGVQFKLTYHINQ